MSFNILEFRDRLEIVQETRSQIVAKCPVCGGTNLKINTSGKKTGAWQCWDYEGDEEHKKAIRDAISPPKRQRDDLSAKPARIAQRRQWIYECDDPKHRIRVDRNDYNPPKRDRNGKEIRREIFQSYKNKNRWVKGGQLDSVTKDHIRSHVLPLYHQEIIDNITPDDFLFICEGEPCVDAMRSLGLFATTVVGAKWSVRDYSEIFRELGDRLVIVPDRDKAGAKFAMEAFNLFPNSRWMHPYPSSPVWDKLPQKGGIDVADWILVSGATREDIEAAVTGLPKVAVANWDQEPSQPSQAIAPISPESLDLLTEVHHIIDRELDEGDTCAALISLSDRTGKPLGVLRQLHKSCVSQRSRDEALTEGASGLRTLLQFARKDIPLEEIFPAALAKAMQTKATSDRIDPIRLAGNFIVASATLLGGKVGIIAKRGSSQHDNWVERAIAWFCDCSAPSTGKSVAQRAIFAPIEARQQKADEEFERQLKTLNELQEDWRTMSSEDKAQWRGTSQDPSHFEAEMMEKVMVVEVGQTEALLKLLSKIAPHSGVCWKRDELSGLFGSLDQYKSGGKGEGKQLLLMAWNGPMRSRVRRVSAAESFNLKGQTLNICGGIQPEVARKLFSLEDDPDGLVSRILPCVPKIPDDFATWSHTTVDLYPYLDEIYTNLETIPASLSKVDSKDFYFSPEAQQRWIARWETLKRGQKSNLENNPSFSYFLGKQVSYVPRFALILHCIEVACGDREMSNEVSLDTLRRAIALSDYFCGQFLLLQSSAATDTGKLSGDLLKVWQYAAKKGGTVSKRDIQQGFRNKKWKAAQIQKLFDAIVAQGLAKIDQKKLVILENDQHDQQIAETHAGKGIGVLQIDQHPINIDQQNSRKARAGGTPSAPSQMPQPPVVVRGSSKNVDHVDQNVDHFATPQSYAESGSQRFVDHVDHSLEDHGIELGSEWVISGRHLVVTAVDNLNVLGVIADNDTPANYTDTVANFVKHADGLAPVPEWLRNVANDPNPLKVGDRVEYIGKPCEAQRFYAFPWRITELVKDRFRCVSAEGEVITLKCSRQELRKVEAMAIAQEVK